MSTKKVVGSVMIKWIKNFFNELFKEPELPDQVVKWKEAERLARKFDAEVADLKVQLVKLVWLLNKLEEKDKNK